MKTKLKVYDCNGVKVAPIIQSYSYGGSLAIQLIDVETCEFFDVITVNLEDGILTGDKDTHAYVYAHDYRDYIPKFIEDNKLGSRTGMIGFSGFCQYPEYEFDLSKLNKMSDIDIPCLF